MKKQFLAATPKEINIGDDDTFEYPKRAPRYDSVKHFLIVSAPFDTFKVNAATMQGFINSINDCVSKEKPFWIDQSSVIKTGDCYERVTEHALVLYVNQSKPDFS